MIDYYVLLTTAGQNKLAAAAAGGPAVSLTAVRIGDGGGASYDPNEAQTTLVGERYTAAIVSLATQAGGVIVIEATIPQNTPDGSGRPSGGFNIREAGVYCSDGTLFAIAKMPGGYKPLPSSGASEDMTIRLVLDVGNAGNVTVTLDPATTIGLGRLGRIPWIAVDTVTNAPPGAPAAGATVLVGTAPTGAFSGHAGKIAHWLGAWQLATAPADTVISVADRAIADPARYLKRVDGAWQNATASEVAYGLTLLGTKADHLAGTSNAKAAHPSGVAKAVQAGAWRYPDVAGTANAVIATLAPAPDELTEGMEVTFKAKFTNAGAATFNLNGLGAKPLVRPDGSALIGGEMTVGRLVSVRFDGANWQIQALKSYLPNRGSFGAGGTFGTTGTTAWAVPAGVTRVLVRAWGAGGGGGGCQGSQSAASGGGSGAYVEGVYAVTPGSVINVTAGAPGGGGAGGANNAGLPGGTSSFGPHCSATGGGGGLGASSGGYQATAGGGGAATGGNIFNIAGLAGAAGANTGSVGLSGAGGSTYCGSGGAPSVGAGNQSFGFGGGGGGGANGGTGGAGGYGFVIVEW